MNFVRGNRAMSVPSSSYREWHKDATQQLAIQLRDRRVTSPLEKVSMTIVIFPPDKIKGDLTNKAESIMDLLVDNEILIDDNWFVASPISLHFGGVDRENPRAEIEIYTL